MYKRSFCLRILLTHRTASFDYPNIIFGLNNVPSAYITRKTRVSESFEDVFIIVYQGEKNAKVTESSPFLSQFSFLNSQFQTGTRRPDMR
jgi:hypothetical protein